MALKLGQFEFMSIFKDYKSYFHLFLAIIINNVNHDDKKSAMK